MSDIKMTKREELNRKIMGICSGSGVNVDWGRMLDSDLLGSILSTVVKTEVTPRATERRRSQLMDALVCDDFADRPFWQVLDALCRASSTVGLDIGEGELSDLRLGLKQPSLHQMEEVASFFNRHPSYFLEYRIAYVLSSMNSFLERNPSVASSWFSRTAKAQGLTK